MFSVAFTPSTPMNELRLSTAGSFRISRASACWRSDIAANEIDCSASEIPWITPVSWTGKKPFGTAMYSATVSASVSTATASVAAWWSSTVFSQRP